MLGSFGPLVPYNLIIKNIILGDGQPYTTVQQNNPTSVVLSGYDPLNPPVPGLPPKNGNPYFNGMDVAIGYKAGWLSTVQPLRGDWGNIALGGFAMNEGGLGIAIGRGAMQHAVSPINAAHVDFLGSIAIGQNAGLYLDGTASYNNIAIGNKTLAGAVVNACVGNIVIGANRGYSIINGSNNTLIGYLFNPDPTPIVNGTGNTVVGANCSAGGDTTNNIVLGTGDGKTRVQFDATNWNFTPDGANTSLQIGQVANSVNFLSITGNSVGSSPTITASGASSTIDIRLLPKGNGVIRLLDNAGKTVFNTSSAAASVVNNIQVAGSAAGNNPSFTCVGNDANIGMTLANKGTAVITLSGQTTTITIGAAGGAAALPATPLGYMSVNINGTLAKIPYYTPV